MIRIASITSLSLLFGFNTSYFNSHEVFIPYEPGADTYNAWCEEKEKDCIVKITYKTENKPAELQVNQGLPINNDKIIEIDLLPIKKGRYLLYTYKILYKDENSKVNLAQIIFANKKTSNEFGRSLKRFGLE